MWFFLYYFFYFQVLAVCLYPHLLQDNPFPPDVKLRAQRLLQICEGGSLGDFFFFFIVMFVHSNFYLSVNTFVIYRLIHGLLWPASCQADDRRFYHQKRRWYFCKSQECLHLLWSSEGFNGKNALSILVIDIYSITKPPKGCSFSLQ